MGLFTGMAFSHGFSEIISQPVMAVMEQSINANWLHLSVSMKL